MPKGEQRGNREAKKPKKEKAKTSCGSTFHEGICRRGRRLQGRVEPLELYPCEAAGAHSSACRPWTWGAPARPRRHQLSLSAGAPRRAHTPSSSPVLNQCEHLMDCFIDPFDRPGDAVLSQRRGLLIVDRGPCLCPLGFR